MQARILVLITASRLSWVGPKARAQTPLTLLGALRGWEATGTGMHRHSASVREGRTGERGWSCDPGGLPPPSGGKSPGGHPWGSSLGLPWGQHQAAINLPGRPGWGGLCCRPHSSAMRCPVDRARARVTDSHPSSTCWVPAGPSDS